MFRPNKPILSLVLLTLVLGAVPALAADASGVVNVNTADLEELRLLPRVGPVVAERIVDFREQNGEFQSLEDLILVRGIGERTFERMEPHLALTGATTLTEKVRSPKKRSDAAAGSDG